MKSFLFYVSFLSYFRDKVIPSITDDQSNVNFPTVSEQLVGGDASFKPFLSDPSKQARYERYLGFIKIGAAGKLSARTDKVHTYFTKYE